MTSVVEPPPRKAPSITESVQGTPRARQAPTDVGAYLERLATRIRTTGVATEVRIESGNRAKCIVRCAEANEVDLIAMSTHGRGGIGRLILGNVTEHVICHASKPMFVVRPQKTDWRKGRRSL